MASDNPNTTVKKGLGLVSGLRALSVSCASSPSWLIVQNTSLMSCFVKVVILGIFIAVEEAVNLNITMFDALSPVRVWNLIQPLPSKIEGFLFLR